MNIQGKIVLLIVFVLAISLSIAGAVKDNDSEKVNQSDVVSAVHNFTATYGQCVSERAKIKNDCYNTAKDIISSCRNNIKNQTGNKSMTAAQCRLAYNNEMKQCKTEFQGKKTECAKIKHTFVETLRNLFK